MPRQIGAKLNRGMGLSPVSRSARARAAGIYPSQGEGLGEYGSTAYPTILESYNRESDYKRWRLGQEYFFGTGRSWGDYQIYSLARFVTGAVDGTSKEVTTLFPSTTSPEKTWYASCRTRGSIILPAPITAARVTTDTSGADPSTHTLTLNVSGILTTAQLGVFSIFIGDQFEDSASGPSYPGGLVERDAGSVALTLTAVNVGGLTMTFDLSRPAGRVLRNGRIYWSSLPYNPTAPTIWRTDGTRHLCSSFKFFCCCPDHLGGALANLEFPEKGQPRDRFPKPNAARDVNSAWERQGVGYYRQWRTLPRRRDERRECKHIHSIRWQCGVPWLEPDDYPVGDERIFLEFEADAERRFSTEEILEYFRLRQLNWDRFAITVADAVGIILFPGGDPRDAIRPDARPLLWNDSEEPLPIWCRQNDWWLERGTQRLKIFNASTQVFEDVVTIGGNSFPVLQFVEEGSPGAPVIVP
jgi:hypothetical protein